MPLLATWMTCPGDVAAELGMTFTTDAAVRAMAAAHTAASRARGRRNLMSESPLE
jgi:hypothetical protein